MGISYSYKEEPVKELHGSNAIEERNDFQEKKELKKAIKIIFEEYECPNCGGHRISGNKVIVSIGKVKFFKEECKKGFFGKKYVSRNYKDIFRVYSIYLEPSSFLNPAGYIKCKSCNWKEQGAKGVKWLSINDIANGRF